MISIKNSKLKAFIVIGLFTSTGMCFGQTGVIDSLLLNLQKNLTVTDEVATCILLAKNYGSTQSSKALSYADRASDLLNSLADPGEMIKAGIEMGKVYNLLGRYTLADSLFTHLVVMTNKPEFIRERLDGLIGLADAQYYLGKYEEALTTYHNASETNEEYGDKKSEITINNGIGNILYMQGQYENSTEYYLRSIAIAELTGDKSSLSRTYQKLGKNFRFQARYPEAMEYYLNSVKMAHELNDHDLLATLYNNLGLVHADQSEYPQAIEYYLKSIELEDLVEDRNVMLDAYFNLAGTYSDMKEFDKALANINVVYEADKQANYVWGQALDLNYIGTIHFRQAKYLLAIEYYLESLKLFEEIGAEGNYMDPMIRTATAYLELNQPRTAKRYLNRALESAEKTGLLEYKMYVYKHLSTAEEKLRNFKAAYENHILFKKLADSMASQLETKKLARLEAEFAFQQEKDSLNFVREKDLLSFNSEIEKKTTVQRATLLGLAIVLVLLFAIYYLYSQRTKSNKTLKKALDKNNLLIKEIHHRVKNNLQIVSSLLKIQSNLLEDEKAQSAIRNTQSRVLSMAMVHQNLYKGTEITHVYADKYFESLTESILNTFDNNDDPVEIRKEIDQIRIPADYAVNIGLITNEIITNSLKHAFPFDFDHQRKIFLALKKSDEELKLTVEDNGVGMKQLPNDIRSNSYGWHLIQSLIKSMSGQLNIENNSGTKIRITLSLMRT